jgi:hypothetical protein
VKVLKRNYIKENDNIISYLSLYLNQGHLRIWLWLEILGFKYVAVQKEYSYTQLLIITVELWSDCPDSISTLTLFKNLSH